MTISSNEYSLAQKLATVYLGTLKLNEQNNECRDTLTLITKRVYNKMKDELITNNNQEQFAKSSKFKAKLIANGESKIKIHINSKHNTISLENIPRVKKLCKQEFLKVNLCCKVSFKKANSSDKSDYPKGKLLINIQNLFHLHTADNYSSQLNEQIPQIDQVIIENEQLKLKLQEAEKMSALLIESMIDIEAFKKIMSNFRDLVECPLSLEPMKKAVIATPGGHTFDEEQIMEWLSIKPINPITNTPLKKKQIHANYFARKTIPIFDELWALLPQSDQLQDY